MLEQVKITIQLENSIEEEMNEFKLSVHGDNSSKHRIKEEEEYTVIELYYDDKLTSPRDLYYGRIIDNCLYIGRHQHISGIEYNQIDLYEEFFSTGSEIKIN